MLLLPLTVVIPGCLGQPYPRITQLAAAAREGDVDTMRRILATGVSPNITDPEGNHWTPLLHAIHKRQPEAVDLLLRSGANPELAVGDLSPLLMAVGIGNAAIVRRLLVAGADPRKNDVILLTAVSGGALSDLDNPLLGECHPDVVRALLEAAPDLTIRHDTRAEVAFMFARLNRCRESMNLAASLARARDVPEARR
jgi:ankyrin repeat protein